MFAATKMLLLNAALPRSTTGISVDLTAATASLLSSVESQTMKLRLQNDFYGDIDIAASQFVLTNCNASSLQYLQARKDNGCESASDAYSCPGDDACCDGSTWVAASTNHCKDTDYGDVAGCCLQCVSNTYDSGSDPFDCHAPGAYQFVDVAVCGSDENDEGYDPLPAGYECVIAPAFSVGFNPDDDDTPPMHDCSQLDHDFAIGRSGGEIITELHSGNTSLVYGAMRKNAAFVTQAVVAGGLFFIRDTAKCVLQISPRLNGHLQTDEYNNVVEPTLDFRVYNPYVYPSADIPVPYIPTNNSQILIKTGNFTVVGGTSHGVIGIETAGFVEFQGLFNDGNVSVNDAPTKVHMADLTNEGYVHFSATENVRMQNISNSGKVEVSGLTATATGSCSSIETISFNFVLYEIKNSGIVNFGGGSALLFSVDTTVSSVVHISDGCFYLADIWNEGALTFENGEAVMGNVTNFGDITMVDGSVIASGVVNTGTITIDAGDIDITLKDNTGGIIIAASGVTGTIRLLEGGGEGSVTVPQGVTLLGFNIGDDGDDFYTDDHYGSDDDDSGAPSASAAMWVLLLAVLTTMQLA